MSSINQHPKILNEFAALVGLQQGLLRGADTFLLKILEFNRTPTSTGLLNPVSEEHCTIRQLAGRPIPDFRIVFAPLDYPNHETLNVLLELFERFDCPAQFVSERIQSVTHSFGNQKSRTGDHWFWYHFLCKNISQDCTDGDWVKSGYLLKHDSQNKTTLFCFTKDECLEEKLAELPIPVWHHMSIEPLAVLPLLLERLHRQLDNQVWSLVGQVRSFEQHATQDALQRDPDVDLDFVSLHHIAKNVIHLMEASDAMSKVVVHMSECQLDDETRRDLKYQETLFESVSLRLGSLEKRMQNIIDLGFHLITHRDSKVILQESGSMHTIAFASLIFLPISTVATIFGTQFFNFDPSDSDHEIFQVASTFRLFWLIVIPLTVLILGIWSYFNRKSLLIWLDLGRFNATRYSSRVRRNQGLQRLGP